MSSRRRMLVVAPALAGAILLAIAYLAGAGSTSRAAAVASAAPSAGGPTNTARPTIVGTARQGETLTASNGTWDGQGSITYAYHWQRCDSSGSNCTNISHATNNQYTLTSDDVNKTIAVAVTATDSNGSATAYSSTVGPVSPAGSSPANTAIPTITGTAKVGQTLTATNGTWTGTTPITYTYQWNRCDANGNNCSTIDGATAVTYVAVTADAGHTLVVSVKASNSFGSGNAKSKQTNVVAPQFGEGEAIPVASVSLPDLLVISHVAFNPRVITGANSFTASFKVTDLDKHPVVGALVYAIALPYGLVATAPEVATDSTGVATITFDFAPKYVPKRGNVVFFVRARKPGDNLLAGVAARRLVQVTTRAS
jgi:uncharacterized protein YukE